LTRNLARCGGRPKNAFSGLTGKALSTGAGCGQTSTRNGRFLSSTLLSRHGLLSCGSGSAASTETGLLGYAFSTGGRAAEAGLRLLGRGPCLLRCKV
jgi:hypothetical protein